MQDVGWSRLSYLYMIACIQEMMGCILYDPGAGGPTMKIVNIGLEKKMVCGHEIGDISTSGCDRVLLRW
jgi:hypothetical protein